MNQGIKTIIYPVKDLAQAKAQFTQFLGVEPYAESEYYIGYKIGDQEIGLDPNGHKQGLMGPLSYYHVGDIKKSLQLLLDTGAETQQEIKDVGGGKLIASVKYEDGNTIGLIQLP